MRNKYVHVLHDLFLTWYVAHFFGAGKISLSDAKSRFMMLTNEEKDRLCFYYYCSSY